MLLNNNISYSFVCAKTVAHTIPVDLYLKESMKYIIIGEQAKRARHYPGCTNLKSYICVYMCVYTGTYVKHNSSMGTYKNLQLLMTL